MYVLQYKKNSTTSWVSLAELAERAHDQKNGFTYLTGVAQWAGSLPFLAYARLVQDKQE